VNLSDLAAKGAEPAGFLLTLALPETWTEAWLEAFAEGLSGAAAEWRCPLLGGDTVRASGGLTLSITALGEVPAGCMVRRTTAQTGDLVCVSGTIGDAALGLAVRGGAPGVARTILPRGSPEDRAWIGALTTAQRAELTDRYLHPQPRIGLASTLRNLASAAMDVSDGLAGDLAKMVRASGVTAVIETERVPLSGAARAALAAEPKLLDRILTGGDDYEILCTVAPDRVEAFCAAAQDTGVSLTAIGEVVDGGAIPIFRTKGVGRRYEAGSFSHF
jgi:thiamine-monophosphate kinase